MKDLIVLAFEHARDASEVRDRLMELETEHLIRVADSAVVVRARDGRLAVCRRPDLISRRAREGALGGLLGGTLFLAPGVGLFLGLVLGALAGALEEHDIREDYVLHVSRAVEDGQSALFLLLEDAIMDRVLEELAPRRPRLLRSNLSRAREDELRREMALAQQNYEGRRQAAPTQVLPELQAW